MATKKFKTMIKQRQEVAAYHKQRKYESEWYNLRPILGCANWAIFYLLLGGREVG